MAPGRRDTLILIGAGLASAAAGFLAGPLLTPERGEGRALFSARLSDLSGNPRSVVEWQGRVLVCNFWATWCAPCREEIPLLVAARETYAAKGVEIVGIAIDSATKIVEYLRSVHISYPILLADATGMELMRALGNEAGGLPYTVFFDRDGRSAKRKLGALKAGEIDRILESLTKG